MRAMITIKRNRTMPGDTYLYSVQYPQGGDFRQIIDHNCGHASEAAATAVSLAIQFGTPGYHIFAPKEVMDLIPTDMRSRA